MLGSRWPYGAYWPEIIARKRGTMAKETEPRDIGYYLRATTYVEIYTEKKDGRKLMSGSATGFWYLGGDPPRLHLVTNRHVCLDEDREHYPDYLTAHLRHRESGEAENLCLALYDVGGTTRLWHEFPQRTTNGIRDRDIAVLPYTHAPPFKEDEAAAFDETSLLPENILLDAGDDVRVLGCPSGLYDWVNNLPVVRNATTGSALNVDYLGMKCFIVDAQLHPGISGSPVLTVPHAMSKERLEEGGMRLVIAHSDAYLLGVLSADQGAGLGIVWRASLVKELVR